MTILASGKNLKVQMWDTIKGSLLCHFWYITAVLGCFSCRGRPEHMPLQDVFWITSSCVSQSHNKFSHTESKPVPGTMLLHQVFSEVSKSRGPSVQTSELYMWATGCVHGPWREACNICRKWSLWHLWEQSTEGINGLSWLFERSRKMQSCGSYSDMQQTCNLLAKHLEQLSVKPDQVKCSDRSEFDMDAIKL